MIAGQAGVQALVVTLLPPCFRIEGATRRMIFSGRSCSHGAQSMCLSIISPSSFILPPTLELLEHSPTLLHPLMYPGECEKTAPRGTNARCHKKNRSLAGTNRAVSPGLHRSVGGLADLCFCFFFSCLSLVLVLLQVQNTESTCNKRTWDMTRRVAEISLYLVRPVGRTKRVRIIREM